MATYVALLRGINLGPVNKVPMKELRTMFEGLGHREVRTYLQSGNVVFEANSTTSKKLAGDIEGSISKTFGLPISVVVRSRVEMKRVADGNPFSTEGVEASSLHVMFLSEPASTKATDGLDPDRSPSDEFKVRGKEVYLWFPNGSGRSKLTLDYFEKKLGTTATQRNWNTVTKVLELMER